jgi:hypothetical protein
MPTHPTERVVSMQMRASVAAIRIVSSETSMIFMIMSLDVEVFVIVVVE